MSDTMTDGSSQIGIPLGFDAPSFDPVTPATLERHRNGLHGMDAGAAAYREARIAHWDEAARKMISWRGMGGAYHQRLTQILRFCVPPGQRVLEIGCAQGDLLAGLEPSEGVGVDFSGEMIRQARKRHPHLHFLQIDAHDLELEEQFDVVILSDLVNDLWDVERVLRRVHRLCKPSTRIILSYYSRLWELPLAATERLGLAVPNLRQNWLTTEDVTNLLHLTDFEVMRHSPEILLPLPIPLLSGFCNRFLVRFWPFRWLALANVIVARPRPLHRDDTRQFPVSVVVAARNEAGNIESIFARTPELGTGTELIFVEGGSTDNTFEAIEQAIARHPERRCRLFRQKGKGKGDAVRTGFANARGDILVILDADLTVAPEDLPRFYEAIRTGKGEFINGVRLVYPMEQQSMRFFNLLGNKFFSLVFSWLLGQPIKDTLCGTKVLWRKDYELIAANRHHFGDFDPFGDFDLIFGAAKLNLRLVDLAIRYRQRTYGDTNISRWKHGFLLLRMVAFAARRVKFV
jgi:SAM-dependent methyltransferase